MRWKRTAVSTFVLLAVVAPIALIANCAGVFSTKNKVEFRVAEGCELAGLQVNGARPRTYIGNQIEIEPGANVIDVWFEGANARAIVELPKTESYLLFDCNPPTIHVYQ